MFRMWRTILIYAGVLGVAALALEWMQYQALARTRPGEIWLGLMAAGFLGLGVWAGARLFPHRSKGEGFVANERVKETLGISGREFEVLQLLAAGRSNKEIAADLDVSPNTIKTHVARLYAKLEVSRRTEAVNRARELGMLQ